MQKLGALWGVCLGLMLAADGAFGETPGTMDAEALLKFAPRISLEEKTISTFHVRGTLDFNGIQLRFMVSGKQPDLIALRILDTRDGTPMAAGMGGAFMLYDPVMAEVVVGRATSAFTLSVEKDPSQASQENPDGQKMVFGFGFQLTHEKKAQDDDGVPDITVIDIRAFLSSLVAPLEVATEDGLHFILRGHTKTGNSAKAYITPSRREGAYTKMELYEAGSDKPFLVLDEIVLNQALPAAHFVFPEKKLAASTLPTRQMAADGPVEMALSIGKLVRAVAARLALSGAGNAEMRRAVEGISLRTLDWDELQRNDKKAAAILKALFQDDVAQPPREENKTIQDSP